MIPAPLPPSNSPDDQHADTVERTVTVRLFAAARDLAGCDALEITLPAHAGLSGLRQALGTVRPALSPLLPHLLFAVGEDYASPTDPLPTAGEVIAFPPVSGG